MLIDMSVSGAFPEAEDIQSIELEAGIDAVSEAEPKAPGNGVRLAIAKKP